MAFTKYSHIAFLMVILIFSGTRNNEVMQLIGLFVAFLFKVIATLLDIRK